MNPNAGTYTPDNVDRSPFKTYILHTGGHFKPYFVSWIGVKPLFTNDPNLARKYYTNKVINKERFGEDKWDKVEEMANDMRKLREMDRAIYPLEL